MLFNPSALAQCGAADFSTPRSSPFESSLSGESCPDKSQIGTVEVATSRGGGEVRRFGIFNLAPPPGVAAQIGFAPYGAPVVLDVALPQAADGSYTLELRARNVPQPLDLRGLSLTLWGTPWGASHNGERGNCLNETEPAFAWAKCSVGNPALYPPLAFVSLPTRCSGPLSFGPSRPPGSSRRAVAAAAVNRDSLGQPAELGGCGQIPFEPAAEGLLTDRKASSPSGYNFRLRNDDIGLTSTEQSAAPPIRKAVVSLPPGVSVNPSVGAGLGTCSPAQFAAETATSTPGRAAPTLPRSATSRFARRSSWSAKTSRGRSISPPPTIRARRRRGREPLRLAGRRLPGREAAASAGSRSSSPA